MSPTLHIPRCGPCPHTHRCVQGDGPIPATYMAIGERPGKRENDQGRPFIGPAGEELNLTYLPLAGLNRSQLRVVNTVRCGATGNRKPSDREIRACADSHLPIEYAEGQPQIIFLMGATACKLVPSIDLELQHGLPQEGHSPLAISGNVTYIPMYHPAAGMHRTSLMTPMLEDWERVGQWIRGEDCLPKGEFGDRVYYKEVDSQYDWMLWTEWQKRSSDLFTGWAAIDTERHGPDPWSVQWSFIPTMAHLIRTRDAKLTAQFASWVNYNCEGIMVHQGSGKPGEPGDLDILESLGVNVSRLTVRDTMAEAYRLGNLPQGLKAIGYRKFGVEMRSWADVVTGPSRDKLFEWLGEAIDYAERELSVFQYEQLKTKVKETKKRSKIETRLRAIWKYAAQSDDYNPWNKLWEMEGLKAIIGPGLVPPWPILGIDHVPNREAVYYACQDADMTLRAAIWMDQEMARREAEEWNVRDEDVDKVDEVAA